MYGTGPGFLTGNDHAAWPRCNGVTSAIDFADEPLLVSVAPVASHRAFSVRCDGLPSSAA